MENNLYILVILTGAMFLAACGGNTTQPSLTEEIVTNTVPATTHPTLIYTFTPTTLPSETPPSQIKTRTPTKTATPTSPAIPTTEDVFANIGLERTPGVDKECNCTSWALSNKSLKVFFMNDDSVIISSFTTKEVETNAPIIEAVLINLYPGDALINKVVDTFKIGSSTHIMLEGDAYNALIMYPSSDSIAFMISTK